MDRNKLVIATISWARNREEEILLQQSLTQLSTLGIPMFVTDAGSDEQYVAAIKNLPNCTLLPAIKGLWPQTYNSLKKAFEAGSEYIFYAEPDKLDFFTHSLPSMLEAIKTDEKTGVYIAARSTKGFSTFPAFQQMTETTINNCCAEILGEKIDYIYGPFLMNRNIIPHLDNLDKNIGWGWRPFAFAVAKKLGYRIEAYEGDFYCPVDQREETAKDRIYRMKQMTQNIEALILSTSTT